MAIPPSPVVNFLVSLLVLLVKQSMGSKRDLNRFIDWINFRGFKPPNNRGFLISSLGAFELGNRSKL